MDVSAERDRHSQFKSRVGGLVSPGRQRLRRPGDKVLNPIPIPEPSIDPYEKLHVVSTY